MKVLTFSSRPQTACFHVVNGKRTAVVNRKLRKYADELSCRASHTMNFAVVSPQPSCCVRSLLLLVIDVKYGCFTLLYFTLLYFTGTLSIVMNEPSRLQLAAHAEIFTCFVPYLANLNVTQIKPSLPKCITLLLRHMVFRVKRLKKRLVFSNLD